jgi:hypothetical protein
MCRVVEHDCVGKEDGIELSNELVLITTENAVSVEELSCWGSLEVNMVPTIKGRMQRRLQLGMLLGVLAERLAVRRVLLLIFLSSQRPDVTAVV